MKYILKNDSIILFTSGHNHKVMKTDRRYPKILKTFEMPQDEQDDAVNTILNNTSHQIAISKTEGFEVINGDIFYKGSKLPDVFAFKVKRIIEDNLPLTHFEKFWENLEQNPNFHVVNETGFFDFLEYNELSLTEDGHFIAFRGVSDNYYSIKGSLTTTVIQGKVDTNGKIFNGIGEIVEVRRNGVSDNRDVYCHEGSLHIGQLDYAKTWGERVVVVKVNPKDVVSVPNDHKYQKCRVCKYEVLSDYNTHVTSSVVDSSGNDTIVEPPSLEFDKFKVRLKNYLTKKSKTHKLIKLSKIQNSFSPEWPSREKILAALQELSYTWEILDGKTIIKL